MLKSTGRLELEEWIGVLPNSTVVVLQHYISEDGQPNSDHAFTPDQEFTALQLEETSIGSLAELRGPTRYLFQASGSMGQDGMVPGMLIQFLRKGTPLLHNDRLFQQISLREKPDNTYIATFWSDT